jgi:hypothetical protein
MMMRRNSSSSSSKIGGSLSAQRRLHGRNLSTGAAQHGLLHPVLEIVPVFGKSHAGNAALLPAASAASNTASQLGAAILTAAAQQWRWH